MKPCNCGAAVSGPKSKYCEPCRAVARKVWRQNYEQKNRDKVLESRRAYKLRNREAILEKGRAYARDRYSADPEKALERCKQWRSDNAELVKALNRAGYERRKRDPAYRERNRERCRAWYLKNHERVAVSRRKNIERIREQRRRRDAENPTAPREALRRWCAANPDKVREYRHRRRARLLDGCSPGVTGEQWREICRAHGQRCAYCGTLAKLTVDHVIPVSRGGKDEPSNVVPACSSCNSSKGTKLLSEWRPRAAA